MIATIQGHFITSYFHTFDFQAKDGKPAKHVECYRLMIRDDHAFGEKDQMFIVTIPLEIAKTMGMDKPDYNTKNAGKVLNLEGILTTSYDKLIFKISDK